MLYGGNYGRVAYGGWLRRVLRGKIYKKGVSILTTILEKIGLSSKSNVSQLSTKDTHQVQLQSRPNVVQLSTKDNDQIVL